MDIDIRRAPRMQDAPERMQRLVELQALVRRPQVPAIVKIAAPLSFVLVSMGMCMGVAAVFVTLHSDAPLVQVALRLIGFGGA